jgi:two-component system, cell cycle sensor histidine kinase and response regulator CckA
MAEIESTTNPGHSGGHLPRPFVPMFAHEGALRVPGAKSREEPSGAYKKNATGWETILLVEDDAAVRGVIKRVLEKHGYYVIEASNGVEALEIFASSVETVQLVLSDVVMPRMSGRVLLDRLMALPDRPKILMMSGYTEDEIERHGAFPTGTPFIEKPFSIAAVTHRIRQVLDGAL